MVIILSIWYLKSDKVVLQGVFINAVTTRVYRVGLFLLNGNLWYLKVYKSITQINQSGSIPGYHGYVDAAAEVEKSLIIPCLVSADLY